MIESSVHVEVLELLNKMSVFDTRSIRPLATLLVQENESFFRLYDDPDSDNWNDYRMNGENLCNMKISQGLKRW